MANELIAEAITDYLGERCLDYAEGCPTCEAWAEYDRLYTRPDAPVEGLETVGYAYMNSDGELEYAHATSSEARSTPIVTRSQAEAIIAAERAEKEQLKAELAEALRGNRYAQLERMAVKRAEKAEADNAALTARVARDDAAFQELIKLGKEADTKFEALETQLAALKDAAKSVEDWWLSEGMNHFPGAPYCIFAIRAALEDRP